MKRQAVTWGKLAAAAVAGGVILGGITAVPAMASNAPCSSSTPAVPNASAPNATGTGTSGGACDVSGQVVVASTLALEVGVPSFVINGGPSPSYLACVLDNNAASSGYSLSQAITSPFKGSAIPGNVLAAGDFTAGTASISGTTEIKANSPLVPSGTSGLSAALLMVTHSGLSTGNTYGSTDCPMINGSQPDSYTFNGWNIPGVTSLTNGNPAPGDTYNGVISIGLWG
jgi:hypothetical protein